MKKTKKHRFIHPDPEMNSASVNNTETISGDRPKNNEFSSTRSDLRRVLLTIALFSAIVLAFYFLNQKIDFLGRFIEILDL